MWRAAGAERPYGHQRIDVRGVTTYDVEEDPRRPGPTAGMCFAGQPDDKFTGSEVLTQRLFRTFPNFNFASMASWQCHAASTPSTRPPESHASSEAAPRRGLSFHTDHEQHDDRRL